MTSRGDVIEENPAEVLNRVADDFDLSWLA
jgi:hypothetical protein